MFLVMTIDDNVPNELLLATEDRTAAESRFLEECGKHHSLPDSAREHLLDEGYCPINNGCVTYLDLSTAPTA